MTQKFNNFDDIGNESNVFAFHCFTKASSTGELRDQCLKVEQTFEPTLRDFGLIGSIGSIPSWIAKDLTLDNTRSDST